MWTRNQVQWLTPFDYIKHVISLSRMLHLDTKENLNTIFFNKDKTMIALL